ncbi:hypothetical protein ACMA1I_10230 [Pontibacter sp. 13R65]|uniref:hypothetical protein n=1 Tax=Pontibacter sp. 13R65 TaxID=3127458 RepID=UPI00301BFE92
MYINLYPHKQLDKTKLFFSRSGLFFLTGGAYALTNEIWIREEGRLGWGLAAASVVSAGVAFLCIGLDKIPLKEAFFSMSPDQIRFRVTLYGKEQSLLWQDVASVNISRHQVVFCKKDGQLVTMRTSAIQTPELAHHVQTAIRLAAMEKRITVNEVQMGKFVTSSSS